MDPEKDKYDAEMLDEGEYDPLTFDQRRFPFAALHSSFCFLPLCSSVACFVEKEREKRGRGRERGRMKRDFV